MVAGAMTTYPPARVCACPAEPAPTLRRVRRPGAQARGGVRGSHHRPMRCREPRTPLWERREPLAPLRGRCKRRPVLHMGSLV